MSYCLEPGSNIRNKFKVKLHLPNYATKKKKKEKIENATDVDTPDLAATKDYVALKAEVDKLDINKMVNVSASLNN